ncbi:MAG: DUF3108 domain-containing protein [Alphaproteobacteria bacterium]|nr:DUF3108 domain-containing protein [Alphaproteobacteria bacterium]
MKFARALVLGLLIAALPFASADAKKRGGASTKTTVKLAPSLIPALPPIVTAYDVYVGGFHLVTSTIWFEEQGNAYHVVVKANTRGFWGKLFPWNTILDARGLIDGKRLLPKEFYTRDEWKNKPKITKLHFDGKGNTTPEFDPPSHDENREIVTDEQKRGALDPITALLQMLASVNVDRTCGVPVPVFDGKRRFDITGKDKGGDFTDPDEYGVFKGNARLCSADFKMISGEWKDREHAKFWQKTETEAGREPFQIWLASPGKGLPEIPVRLESGSVAGLVVVHLSSWRYATPEEVKAQSVPQS